MWIKKYNGSLIITIIHPTKQSKLQFEQFCLLCCCAFSQILFRLKGKRTRIHFMLQLTSTVCTQYVCGVAAIVIEYMFMQYVCVCVWQNVVELVGCLRCSRSIQIFRSFTTVNLSIIFGLVGQCHTYAPLPFRFRIKFYHTHTHTQEYERNEETSKENIYYYFDFLLFQFLLSAVCRVEKNLHSNRLFYSITYAQTYMQYSQLYMYIFFIDQQKKNEKRKKEKKKKL